MASGVGSFERAIINLRINDIIMVKSRVSSYKFMNEYQYKKINPAPKLCKHCTYTFKTHIYLSEHKVYTFIISENGKKNYLS